MAGALKEYFSGLTMYIQSTSYQSVIYYLFIFLTCLQLLSIGTLTTVTTILLNNTINKIKSDIKIQIYINYYYKYVDLTFTNRLTM